MNIDSNLVRTLIDDQFPQWSGLPISPVPRSGWDNRTFRLGEHLSVRMPSAQAYASQVPKEQKWLSVLSEQLSVNIPCAVELGKPDHGYPWSWSVYKWIEGEDIKSGELTDSTELAKSVAEFISELHQIDSQGGPPAGEHSHFRGGSLMEYHEDTCAYIELLANEFCVGAALDIWSAAVETSWTVSPVWVHGDLEASNLLVSNDELVAVIDFGNCAVGDPACDLVMAWTFFAGAAQDVFRSHVHVDSSTWSRGRAWALWKALFRMASAVDSRNDEFSAAKQLVESIISD